MSPLPTPSRLSLASAVQRIAKATGVSALDIELLDSIYDALCRGDITARGSEEDRDGNITRSNHEVPTSVWRGTTAQQFRERYASHRVGLYDLSSTLAPSGERFLVNVTLDVAQIDRWLKASEPTDLGKAKREPRNRRQQSAPHIEPISTRGPRPVKRLMVEREMRAQIAAGRLTWKALADEKEEALSATYRVSRDTARKARNNVLKQHQ
jgi:hypothetical protein